ncbi:MAG: Asp23/Gls24 family envelope stress response protein, partial [Verrucomicrobia bacterium]|nr:Asp23/Gls24 family envelope stress response protein [Verrucomicrobiota bacterium]
VIDDIKMDSGDKDSDDDNWTSNASN